MLPLAKQSLDEAPYKLSRAVVKLAGITFWSLAFSWIRLNLGFLLREKLAAVLIIPSSWGSQLDGEKLSTPCRIKTLFWRRCQGKRRLLQGEFHTHILYFVLSFAFLYFYLHHFIKKYTKIIFLIVVFTCLLLVLLEWLLLRTPGCVILLA
jgi:hypothetical protein